MKRLRAAAKIEYIGEFAELEKAADKAPASAPAAEPAPAASGTAAADKGDFIKDGVKGLK
jgi:hypothetical protein